MLSQLSTGSSARASGGMIAVTAQIADITPSTVAHHFGTEAVQCPARTDRPGGGAVSDTATNSGAGSCMVAVMSLLPVAAGGPALPGEV
jgi:hypothetical protein